MKNKIFVILIMLVLSLPIVIIFQNDTIVCADPPPQEPQFDFNYIYNITYKLSDIIYSSYGPNELAQGRFFATPGERDAAVYLADEMEKIGLYDPTNESTPNKPYREKITNLTIGSGYLFNKTFFNTDNLTTKLEILNRSLTLKNLTTGNITAIEECYISPRWNLTRIFPYPDKNTLTYCFNETDIHIEYPPANKQYFGIGNISWFNEFITNTTIVNNILTNLSLNKTLNNSLGIKSYLLEQIENYYSFHLETLNASDNTTWPETFEQFNKNYNYTVIREDRRFHPDDQDMPEIWEPPYTNYTDQGLKHIFWNFMHELSFAIWFKLNPQFKGVLEFDFNNETYDMNPIDKFAYPVISINGTLGKEINASINNFRLNYKLDQRWNTSVDSYNVIGQLNGTNHDKYIVISCLFDSVWSGGSADSAIGMGIVMALAKYMKELSDYGVKPIYDIRFIGFSGEEYGLVGAQHYNFKHFWDKIPLMIDLNQLGFNLTKMDLDIPDKFRLEMWTNKLYAQPFLQHIGERSNYEERTDGYTTFEAKCGLTKEDFSIIDRLDGGRPGNQNVFAATRPNRCTTVYILKMGPWRYHHRDNHDHTEGDVLKYYDWKDVNVSAEMILNTSKYLCYRDVCWFDEPPTYTLWDSNQDDNQAYDTINISYTINTSLPEEPVSVRLILYPKYTLLHPGYPLRYRLRERAQYKVTSEGLQGYMNVTLPKNFPNGDYVANVYLTSSIDDDKLDTIQSFTPSISGEELIEEFQNTYDIDIIEKLFDNQSMIMEHVGLDLVEWILRQTDLNKIKQLLVDFLGYFVLNDGHKYFSGLPMAPPNDPPDQPTIIDGPSMVKLGTEYTFTAETTDPNNDQMLFKWKWGILDYSGWSKESYTNYEDHIKKHTWDDPILLGSANVRVKARDYLNPSYHSIWSTPHTITVNQGCGYNTIPQSSFNPQSSPNHNIVLVNQENVFEGENYGITITRDINYTYAFGDQTYSYEPDGNHTYNTTGVYNVSYTIDNGTINATFYDAITVVNTSAGFNVSSPGGRLNQTITFTNVSQSIRTIENFTWDFGDGNITYLQNPQHAYQTPGIYNVTLTIEDSNNETSACYLQLYVENNPPVIIDTTYTSNPPCVGSPVTIYADVYDNQSSINNVTINISCPYGDIGNYTMVESLSSVYDYEYQFIDTDQVGWYFYTIWVSDKAGNLNYSSGYGFNVTHSIGYSTPGTNNKNIMNNITGSNYTILVNGTADSITAHLQCNNTPAPTTRCMIYRANDSVLIGATEEKIINTGDNPSWMVYNFTGTQPTLIRDTEYVISIWSNSSANLSYDNTTNLTGRYTNEYSYNVTLPGLINWTANETRRYSLYCTYNAYPEITNVYTSPSILGFGYNATIYCDIEDNACGIDNVSVNISYPNNTTGNYTMNNIENNTYQYLFADTWTPGQYNYTIWVKDGLYQMTNSSVHSFNVSVNATIQVCTIKNNYTGNETINLTDPPTQPITIGHELLDNNQILHIWNKYDHYYFDTNSGIQLTNHKDDYWSQNVLMLGYYNNDKWNLVYRTDELSGFTKTIDTDNQTYVNATLWKDLNYNGYDFRLAICYHLGMDDNELTIIPYIKNLGSSTHYQLGFGWELKDIQIDMTEENDFIEIDDISYYLNNTLNESYTTLEETKFTIKEDITPNKSESLYMIWDDSLNYKLTLKSRENQYNAPVTLFIKIGTLAAGQEKYTELFWYDASQTTYYFDDYVDEEWEWTNNPGYMTDGNINTFASTEEPNDIELLDSLSLTGEPNSNILMVEIRAYGYDEEAEGIIYLRPVFDGIDEGSNHEFNVLDYPKWSEYYDITEDVYAPETWDWSDVANLDCVVESIDGSILSCACVEVRVTYSLNPTVNTPYPSNGAIGVDLMPMLNITVADPDGDSMTITWLCNSSGSWQAFGTNSSVSNGTYHQTFSNATENGKWWYWRVNVSDVGGYVLSSIYKFYTGHQSKIQNTGSTNISGYLLIQVQYYNTTSTNWEVALDTINETTPRTINASDQLGLDTIFNGLVNTNDLSLFGSGTYRVYAAFRDPDGNVLVCNDETLLEATYEFTITFE